MPLSYDEQLRLLLIDKAAIGGLLLLAGFFLNRWLEGFRAQQAKVLEAIKNEHAREVERLRWFQAREDEIAAGRRMAIADLTKKLAAGNHSISWLTWKAKYDPSGVTEENALAYDSEMHSILTDLVGCSVNLAAIDPKLYDKFAPLVKQLVTLDSRVARAIRELSGSPDKINNELKKFHSATERYDEQLTAEALGIIASVSGITLGKKSVSETQEYEPPEAHNSSLQADG